MPFYPVYLDLHGRACLVVGGGPIATGKVRGLIEAGALVTVVAPEAGQDITAWAAEQAVTWHRRAFEPADLDGQFLSYAATDDRDLNARIYRLAEQAGRVANAVDDLDHCNFIAPAIVRQGPVQVAVSTAGTSPALAKQIRDRIRDEVLTPQTGVLAEYLGSWRPEVRNHVDTYERRQALWEGVLEGCVPALVAEGDRVRADAAMREFLARATRQSDQQARCVVGSDRPDVCRACKGV
ncbi:bifunctional precorrin-2 dehydrogenase/sirohydrochlorin ferrochelatase [Luteitalea sp. TBR-22]|uniref:precorrin-2 dehydrogenase/sirohydrochlorin ferrochelatase family protein n=1 Tax=Luteitalea sp. TBR-22 TaxID=2802971 RepID=UPI001EF675A5|nr:bifunctional precorrin-2 dehydrogenase/sirohydrochlorin ferrochelatase [Luteitalea sp. TBR-22]